MPTKIKTFTQKFLHDFGVRTAVYICIPCNRTFEVIPGRVRNTCPKCLRSITRDLVEYRVEQQLLPLKEIERSLDLLRGILEEQCTRAIKNSQPVLEARLRNKLSQLRILRGNK